MTRTTTLLAITLISSIATPLVVQATTPASRDAAIAAPAAIIQTAVVESRRITSTQSKVKGIEGPAVDAAGNLYVVNFKERGTIGRLRPGRTEFEPFATLDQGSVGNGIRFDRAGRMYVADFKGNQVLV